MQKLCGSHKNVNDFKLGEECILTCLVLEIPCVGHGLDMNLNWDFTHTISDLTCDLKKKVLLSILCTVRIHLKLTRGMTGR